MTERATAVPSRTEEAPGPDSPLDLGAGAWRSSVRRALKKFSRDRCSMSAGSLAYHWFLALFPAVVALLGVITLLHVGSGFTTSLVNGLRKALPSGASGVFVAAVRAATKRSSGGSTVAVIVGVLLAVWSASGAMTALQMALDVAYEVPRSRSFLAKKVRALPLMAATLLLGGTAAALLIFGAPLGSAIAHHMPVSGTAFIVVWTVVRWAVTVVLVSLLFSFYYFYGPNRATPHWSWVSPGGVIGTLIFLAASVGFSFYVVKLGSYGKTYGAFAGVVILIFWFYLTGLAVLLGSELNAEFERHAAAAAGHPQAVAALDSPPPTR